MWDGTTARRKQGQRPYISIHPSRVGWDSAAGSETNGSRISIHPSRVGWDRCAPCKMTPVSYFNPPIPCGMGLPVLLAADQQIPISIHPSRVGWDLIRKIQKILLMIFQSTHPVWDGTLYARTSRLCLQHFNPPIPCGMGPFLCVSAAVWRQISIHPSRVGWDEGLAAQEHSRDISIHPSRVGWDDSPKSVSLDSNYFNPPIPCGMGLRQAFRLALLIFISIHPSRVGWD